MLGNKNHLIILLLLAFFSSPSHSAQPLLQVFTKNPQQGSMIVGRMLVDGEIYFEGKRLPLTETGEFVLGVGRDAPDQILLDIRSDNKTQEYPLYISKRQWELEKVNGLSDNKVNPKSEKALARIKSEASEIAKARKISSTQNAFLMQFVLPAKGRISGVYGSQRVLNGQPKRPHFGLDIANVVGTSILSPADGVVTLAESDFFYSGGTIIIDHGFGINTTYLHLSNVLTNVGETIKQGDLIGKMGSTGRATGSHLDWRLNWFSTRLDPYLITLDVE